ncbi:MAG TPA: hypothetical protein DD706_14590 [Nitrospiraceae bacterium]|nr:hypothetical protein [Nitrospiraceae bacterium]
MMVLTLWRGEKSSFLKKSFGFKRCGIQSRQMTKNWHFQTGNPGFEAFSIFLSILVISAFEIRELS